MSEPYKAPVYPQIPWAKETKVTYKNGFITLQKGNTELEVWNDGDVRISFASQEDIKSYMELDSKATQELRTWIEVCEEPKDECVRMWAQGNVLYFVPPGTLEWRPPEGAIRADWKLGMYRQDQTVNHENWRGDGFKYTHFEGPDFEGLVVFWNDEPEVWIGDVEGFMSSQEESDPDSMDTFRVYNEMFENGILWAFDEMGVFEGGVRIPDPVVELVWEDPELLWGELLEKLIPQVGASDMDPRLEEAVRVWLMRRRREAERATGQKFLWPRLYPRK